MKETVALIGILLAVFTRTLMPYWRKVLKASERGEKIVGIKDIRLHVARVAHQLHYRYLNRSSNSSFSWK